MACKRMFDKAIIDTDRFMDLPISCKALYFLLGMEADDEGFVSYKKVIRIHGGNEDDVKVLITKEFLISFPTGVVVITDWNVNNWLDHRRIKETEYKREKKQLVLNESKRYELNVGSATAPQLLRNGGVRIEENRIEENRIEENRIEENRIEENRIESEPSSQVNEIIDSFYKINPTINWGNKTQRKACEELIVKFGKEKLLAMLNWYKEKMIDKFCPIATTPIAFKNKLGDIMAYSNKLNNSTNSKIINLD